MAKTKTVSDEIVIRALIEHGSVTKAAEAVGLSPRTIYDRFQYKGFLSDYNEAKTDFLRSAVLMLNKKLVEAIETVASIQADENANPAIRLQAAQTLIKHALLLNNGLCQTENDNRETRDPLNFSF